MADERANLAADTEPPSSIEELQVSRQAIARRRLTAILAGLYLVSSLGSDWDQFFPAHFGIQTVWEWLSSLCLSLVFAFFTGIFLFYYDSEGQRFRLRAKVNYLIAFTVILLIIFLSRRFHTLINPPSAFYLVRTCVSLALGGLYLGAVLAVATTVILASIKNITRPTALLFAGLAFSVLAVVLCWDWNGLQAAQTGGATLTRFSTDIAFALIVALVLHGYLAPSSRGIPSVVPHETPSADRNSAAAPGV
jgi:hypothetical protein